MDKLLLQKATELLKHEFGEDWQTIVQKLSIEIFESRAKIERSEKVKSGKYKKINWEFEKGQILENINGIDYWINDVLPNNEIIVTSKGGWQCTAISPSVYDVDGEGIRFDWIQSKNGRFLNG